MPAGNLPRGVLKSGRGSLVRDVIYDALCGPKGYFATRLPVLAAHTALPFREMTGRADYERALTERYAERAGFLTPAEIFAPWYSYAAARWALAWHRVDAAKAARVGLRPPQLRVAEFGVGSGAHAVHFLDYVRTHAPAVFATCRYAGVDASQGACAAFEARLRAAHPGVAATIVADARSAWALPEGFSDDSTPTVVFALELLDNLPHDKVRGGFEGWVVDGREDFRPVSDPWVRKALALETVGGDAFVPTGALQFLARVFAGAPRPRLFLADFSQLPRPEGATAANGRRRRRRRGGAARGVLRARAGSRSGHGHAVGLQPAPRGLLEHADLPRAWPRCCLILCKYCCWQGLRARVFFIRLTFAPYLARPAIAA